MELSKQAQQGIDRQMEALTRCNEEGFIISNPSSLKDVIEHFNKYYPILDITPERLEFFSREISLDDHNYSSELGVRLTPPLDQVELVRYRCYLKAKSLAESRKQKKARERRKNASLHTTRGQ